MRSKWKFVKNKIFISGRWSESYINMRAFIRKFRYFAMTLPCAAA